MTSLPSATGVLKPMIKYLQQARQVEKVDPLVAYYARMFAVTTAMKIAGKSKEDSKCIEEHMVWLEKHHGLTQAVTKEEGQQRAEALALQVFSHGDDEDRAGLATKKTALTFHASYVLMDICRQFSKTGDLPSDLEEKQRYAVVKAADINRAIKEGRKPKAGPLNEPTAEEQAAEDEALLATLGGSTPAPASSASAPAPAASSSWSSARTPPVAASSMDSAPLYPAASLAPLPPTFNPNAYFGAPDASSLPDSAGHYMPPSSSFSSSSAPPFPSASASAPPSAAAPTPAKPPATSARAPAAAPAPSHSPFSAASSAARNAAGPGASSFGQRDPRKLDAVRDSERLIKHALSAIVFSDVDTTVTKLKEALALLQPFTAK